MLVIFPIYHIYPAIDNPFFHGLYDLYVYKYIYPQNNEGFHFL